MADEDFVCHGKIIDAWAQPPANALFELLPEGAHLIEKTGQGAALQALANVPESTRPQLLLAAMDAAGIDRMLLCAWHRPGRTMISNNEVAMYTRFSSRFVGVASVDLAHPESAVQELERAVRELGFVALRVIPWLWGLPPDNRLYYPLYAKCVELGIPFCTQVGHAGPRCASEPGRPIPYLEQVLLDFPSLKVVMGHVGMPWFEEVLSLLWKFPNAYVDTSAYLPHAYPPRLLEFLQSAAGRNRVLVGSNFPMIPLSKWAGQVRRMRLPPAVQHAFCHENAARVFRLAPQREVGEGAKL
mmetsp:Transcript_38110/g.95878  ORF Transcript_38110/g.95878 Transcript_38110/m.95878 type:complete len:300 (+) Transcript_38110:191-1090(+)|eukprot:CAMPEP_0177672244 /NCGR_PEP_ID=MMETSP0447-20121125/25213_1 /TAXON_ID=0 /ORGANISM="Stygamoeba regulata, Strain BSH-02190019" /LENGTH=299 /DNA_ID=CAMNT_0019179849 /DNA_START=65 /DNA_END=964 /DNA_ORIENTATION=+